MKHVATWLALLAGSAAAGAATAKPATQEHT